MQYVIIQLKFDIIKYEALFQKQMKKEKKKIKEFIE